MLSISIVIFGPMNHALLQTVQQLIAAVQMLREQPENADCQFFLVNNNALSFTELDSNKTLKQTLAGITHQIIEGHGNVGYGRGHNLALQRTTCAYHLILNPDVMMERQALVQALDFLEEYKKVGLLTPQIKDQNGKLQYLCRRYPTLFDLFLRGFAPIKWRQRFKQRLARYEMQDLINETQVVYNPLIVSGCFMLFRTDVLKKLGGFDSRYFLYFEDYDLSLRARAVADIAYVPVVSITHLGGDAARKGWRHRYLFCCSAFKFFQRFGFRLK